VTAEMGLPRGRGVRRPTPHSLRHAFAVRALQACSDRRDHITQHMLMLSTDLGHSKAADTYWYLEAVPTLMLRGNQGENRIASSSDVPERQAGCLM
jgi:integrase/recombinase XerD